MVIAKEKGIVISPMLDEIIYKCIGDVKIAATAEAALDVKNMLDGLHKGYGRSIDQYYDKLDSVCKEKGISV